MEKKYDVLILGAGPAGMSAALYSARFGLLTGIISKDIGGMANMAHKLENYPGFDGSGMELMKKFNEQAKKSGAEFIVDEIGSIRKEKNEFLVETKSGKNFHSKALILALGTEKRKLNLENEDKLLGRGVSYCAVCDGFFFKGKDIAVIGGGDSACKSALMLAETSKKVYLLYRKENLKGEKKYCEKINEKNNIEVLFNTAPKKIKGKEKVESLVINQDGKEREIKIQGIFIEIGTMPTSAIAKETGVKIDENGFIYVNENMETNVKGIFAAGDIVKSRLKQIILASAQGVIAAKSAYDYLSG